MTMRKINKFMSRIDIADGVDAVNYYCCVLERTFKSVCDLRIINWGYSATAKDGTIIIPCEDSRVYMYKTLVFDGDLYDFINDILLTTKTFDRRKTCLVIEGFGTESMMDSYLSFGSYVAE